MTSSSATRCNRAYGQIHIRVRPETGRLYLDYHRDGCRRRQHTGLSDSPANRRRAQHLADQLAAARLLGLDPPVHRAAGQGAIPNVRSPLFAEFAQRWLADLAPQWRLGSRETSALLVDTYLLPSLGGSRVDAIGREALFALRRRLAVCGRRDGGGLSPKVVNESMRLAGRILDEAARRYKFESPSAGVGPVPAAPTEVEPFTVAQMRAILTQVDGQDRALLTVAFGTGLRPGEIAGLQWSDVNLGGCTLQVRRTRSRGRVGAPKTAAGRREVRLTAGVTAALREQALRTRATGESVFQTAAFTPIDIKNFAARVWHPALRALGLPPRRLYTTRHTYASLALAAGESPAWIARQLGHENTEPLFRIYGHFVPRTGSRDGAAFERLVAAGVLPPVQLEIFDAH